MTVLAIKLSASEHSRANSLSESLLSWQHKYLKRNFDTCLILMVRLNVVYGIKSNWHSVLQPYVRLHMPAKNWLMVFRRRKALLRSSSSTSTASVLDFRRKKNNVRLSRRRSLLTGSGQKELAPTGSGSATLCGKTCFWFKVCQIFV